MCVSALFRVDPFVLSKTSFAQLTPDLLFFFFLSLYVFRSPFFFLFFFNWIFEPAAGSWILAIRVALVVTPSLKAAACSAVGRVLELVAGVFSKQNKKIERKLRSQDSIYFRLRNSPYDKDNDDFVLWIPVRSPAGGVCWRSISASFGGHQKKKKKSISVFLALSLGSRHTGPN